MRKSSIHIIMISLAAGMVALPVGAQRTESTGTRELLTADGTARRLELTRLSLPTFPDLTCRIDGFFSWYGIKNGMWNLPVSGRYQKPIVDSDVIDVDLPLNDDQGDDIRVVVWLQNIGGRSVLVSKWKTTVTRNGMVIRTFVHNGEENYALSPETEVSDDSFRFSSYGYFIPWREGDQVVIHTAIEGPSGEIAKANNSCHFTVGLK